MAGTDKRDYQIIPLQGELLKKLQQVELSILEDITQFCDENQITYFLTSGTLLGAVRHKGFIPWDDDIDISMPRKDFEKFLKLKAQLPPIYECEATRFQSQYPIPIVKIRKKGTVMKEPGMADLDICHGIWIDVFPLDRVKYIGWLTIRAHWIALMTTVINYKLGLSFNIRTTTRILCKLIGIMSIYQIDRIRSKIMTMEENSDGEYFTSFASNIGYKKLLLEKDVYFPVQTELFENLKLCIPAKPEEWLTAAYGDYMTLPPKNEQINRHKIVEIKL